MGQRRGCHACLAGPRAQGDHLDAGGAEELLGGVEELLADVDVDPGSSST
jgi:hypothetical protein